MIVNFKNLNTQGGVTPVASVLPSATAVKIGQNLDRKIFILALHIFCDCIFIAEISLDLDQLIPCISKRYSGLTVDYEEYFKLTNDFYFDRGRRW